MASKKPPARRLVPALTFFRHDAAGGIVLLAAARSALDPAELAGEPSLRRAARNAADADGGRHPDRQAALALDQRRPDGDLLLPGRARDQARAARRASCRRASRRLLPVIAALGGMVVPALIYVGDQPRRSGRAARLGHPGRDRHRLRGRRAGAARPARPAVAQGVPAGARHHRRPRRHRHHRRVLHRGAVAAGARRSPPSASPCWRCSTGAAWRSIAAYVARRAVHLGVRAEIRRARDAVRRRHRARDPAGAEAGREAGHCWSGWRRACTRG